VRKIEQDSDSETNVAHWIVSFVGDAEEHEVTEKYIGRLVESSETESVKSTQTPPSARAAATTTTTTTTAKSRSNTTKSTRKEKSPPRKAKSPLNGSIKGEVRPSTRSTIKQPVAQPVKLAPIKKGAVKCVKTIKKPPARGGGGGGSKPAGENETVVKVKMLTGTLYLYRGDRPRAEFIRTV
jgi:hypothetical protein